MNINEFKQFVKDKRSLEMLSPFDLTYKSFDKLGYTEKQKKFFLENASEIVDNMRDTNWEGFLNEEKQFSVKVYEELIDRSVISNMEKVEAIKWFLNEYSEHIYALSLSNTQSRRSRAGNEFECIIEFILMGAEIPFDTQGTIGEGMFKDTRLAKLVDCVSPGAIEYSLDKRNTSLISAKTTLRERWQEVGDEMARTKAREMYLATLDDSISRNTIDLIGSNNIILVTTKTNKDTLYEDCPSVISFETMLKELEEKTIEWRQFTYPDDELHEKRERYVNLITQFKDKPFMKDYYKNQLELLNK